MNPVVAARAVAGHLEIFVLLLPPLRVEQGGGLQSGDPVHPVVQPVHQVSLAVRHPAALTLSQGGDSLLLA